VPTATAEAALLLFGLVISTIACDTLANQEQQVEPHRCQSRLMQSVKAIAIFKTVRENVGSVVGGK
jgi:hypothetical protein